MFWCFFLFHLCITKFAAADKLKVGIIDHPDGRWGEKARLDVASRDLPLVVTNMTLKPPIGIKRVLEVKDFIRKEKISLLIGPDIALATLVSSEQLVPYIIAEENNLLADIVTFDEPEYVLTMFPGPRVIKNLLADLVEFHQWDHLYVIHDSEAGHNLIGYLMSKRSMVVQVLQMEHGSVSEEKLIQDMILFRNVGKRNIMVLAHPNNIRKVLNAAMKLSLLIDVYHWVFLTLDAIEIDFTPWADSGINATMFQLSRGDNQVKKLPLQDCLLVDALTVVSEIAKKNGGRLGKGAVKKIIKKVKVHGLTGPIQFNEDGFRINLELDVFGVNETGIFKKGVWNEKGKNIKQRLRVPHLRAVDGPDDASESWPLGKSKVRVVSILEEPFLMYKKNRANATGNGQFKGYCVDLLNEMSQLINFDYEIYLVPDGQFGTVDEDGKWDGMVGELMIGNASLAVAPLIISSLRESVVDFTKPFKTCDMNVLIARPAEKSSLLQFMTPLHWSVWMLIVVAVVVLSVVLTVIDRFNPNDEFDAEQPRYTYSESLWFFYASFVQAGTEGTPQVLSARILGSFWWFFSLIIVSSYTANMAAFLTMSQISTPITGILSLRDQSEITYGTVKGSRAADFFQRSNRETYKNMWLAMNFESNMVWQTQAGVNKVIGENYAFIWDSPVNDYIATQDCRTMAVGGPFNRQGYGIGVPRGATYRDDLTIAILKLNEKGTLQKLDQKYWGMSKCSKLSDGDNSDTAELEIENVGGIFIILSAGVLISLVVCAGEYFWRKRIVKSTNVHPKSVTIEDKWNELQERRKNANSQ